MELQTITNELNALNLDYRQFKSDTLSRLTKLEAEVKRLDLATSLNLSKTNLLSEELKAVKTKLNESKNTLNAIISAPVKKHWWNK